MSEKIIPDQIIRSRRKTLSVTVDVFGRVIVRAPLRYGEERIFSFLEEKRAWIIRHKTRRMQAAQTLPSADLEGYRFLLLGRYVRIRLYNLSRIRFERGEEEDVIFLPKVKSRERLLKWLKENAKRIFSAEAERRASEMGVSFRSVSVGSAKSRWGSCSADNALHFSFRLIYAPREVIDYVIVHELAHTVHKNHGSGFWALVEKYVPRRKALRTWLKDHAFVMEIF